MAEWSEKTANYVKKQIAGWTEEFLNSATIADADKAAASIAAFADTMYDTHLKTPKTWTGAAAEKAAEKADKAILAAFIAFLGEAGYIKNAKTLLKAIDAEKAAETPAAVNASETDVAAKDSAVEIAKTPEAPAQTSGWSTDYEDPEQAKYRLAKQQRQFQNKLNKKLGKKKKSKR